MPQLHCSVIKSNKSELLRGETRLQQQPQGQIHRVKEEPQEERAQVLDRVQRVDDDHLRLCGRYSHDPGLEER
jgi:hypothetical protein